MKKVFSAIFLCISFLISFAQLESPVKWKYEVNRISDTEAELLLKATIQKDWHLYAIQHDGMELPLVIEFTPSGNYEKVGKTIEPKPKVSYDSMFQMYSKYFTSSVTFKQKIKIKTPDKAFKIKGKLSGQACIDGRCTQVQEDFVFSVAAADGTGATTEAAAEDEPDGAESDAPEVTEEPAAPTPVIEQQPEKTESASKKEESLWLFFLTSIGGGLIGLLMPCVFPMIPMTVSFFLKKGKQGKMEALFYGLSIVVIFVLFGIILAALLGPDFANILSTHWIPNVLFAIIFVIFAISLFGYFEITLPSSWVNKSAKNEQRGGLVGTFFMALTLVLVSFSCTLPIAGAVALNAAGGSFLKPIIGMLGFSLGIAVPFTLFALFPSLLGKMPKSGGWMNTLKVILAFIELAFALKFLNVPDQTYHWGILDREVYLAFWIVIFSLLGFYLIGKIRFPADDEFPVQKSPVRFIAAIFTFTFVIYMIPGMWGAPLNAISGWLPPVETQDFVIQDIVREELESVTLAGTSSKADLETPHYAEKLQLPFGIKGYFDYDQALQVAQKQNKPVFIDFTGHGCTNCRKVENMVWNDPRVRKKFAESFVVVALYVDDKNIELQESDYLTDENGNIIKMLGEKNTYIGLHKYQSNSQPCYFIVDTDGSVLAGPQYYELDIDKYLKFLESGATAFQQKHAN